MCKNCKKAGGAYKKATKGLREAYDKAMKEPLEAYLKALANCKDNENKERAEWERLKKKYGE